MRLPHSSLKHAMDLAEKKAIATRTIWYVNRLASSGSMRYEVSDTPITDTSFGGGTLLTIYPPGEKESCPKCGARVLRQNAFEDEGEGPEAGRTFYYCSERCRETH